MEKVKGIQGYINIIHDMSLIVFQIHSVVQKRVLKFVKDKKIKIIFFGEKIKIADE